MNHMDDAVGPAAQGWESAGPVELAGRFELGRGGQLPRPRRICMLAVHTCPLAAPGGKETGGMNVYVRELMRQLGRRGYLVDCFTRSQSSAIPHIPDTDLGPNVRVIHVTAGA